MDKSGPIFVGEPLGETLSALSVSIRGAAPAPRPRAKRPKWRGVWQVRQPKIVLAERVFWNIFDRYVWIFIAMFRCGAQAFGFSGRRYLARDAGAARGSGFANAL